MSNTVLLGMLDLPPGPLMGLAMAVVVGVLLIWGIKQPLAWVVVALLAIGCGFGCAGYGLTRALLGSGERTTLDVEWLSSFIGGGAGATVAGIVLLIVSLVRCRKSPAAKAS